jgi:SEC-C motif domain protein
VDALMNDALCPCGSGAAYDQCCGRYLAGPAAAPTAEALMRSRYTAYTRDDRGYIARTWDPDTVPDLADTLGEIVWCGLAVLATEGGGVDDHSGMVEFIAHYRVQDKPGSLHEVSHFRKAGGQWLYVGGETVAPQPLRVSKTGRNDPCPCGSGRKFKKCCGA